jgi:hypothetical protein
MYGNAINMMHTGPIEARRIIGIEVLSNCRREGCFMNAMAIKKSQISQHAIAVPM